MSGKAGQAPFDEWLDAIHERTNPIIRFGRELERVRLLWLDPHPENNTAAFEFLRAAGRVAGSEPIRLATVGNWQDALVRLQNPETMPDLIITHWGEGLGEQGPAAISLLEAMRRRDIRIPVVVFAAETDAERRARAAVQLGAQGYYYTFEALFPRLQEIVTTQSMRRT